MKIKNIKAIEILDSRGIPTLSTEIELWSGDTAKAEVPSGASTGEKEVLELRDNDETRYSGKGVLNAVEIVNTKIKGAIVDKEFGSQKQFDELLLQLDGTKNKSNLGGNTILSCSMAFCRATSLRIGLELYQYLAMIYWDKKYDEKNYILPKPQILLLEGAKHGNWATDIQEYMIIPRGNMFPNIEETLRAGSEIFTILNNILDEKGYSVGVGYEGAFAPREIKSNREAFDLIMESLRKSQYKDKFEIAIDIAASEFYNRDTDKYELKRENQSLTPEEWFNLQKQWYSQYPIYSVEDPFDENAWSDWSKFTQEYGDKYQIVGDDLLVTNTELIKEGIDKRAMNSVLIKLNQIGSVSETLDAIKITVDSNMTAIISHRSGETTDPFIADLAVATAAQQCKFGALSRGERVVKYNRLLEISSMLLQR